MNGRWALGPEVKRGALARGAMLYDASRVSNLTAEWFTPRYWESRGVLERTASGRGAAYFFSADGRLMPARKGQPAPDLRYFGER